MVVATGVAAEVAITGAATAGKIILGGGGGVGVGAKGNVGDGVGRGGALKPATTDGGGSVDIIDIWLAAVTAAAATSSKLSNIGSLGRISLGAISSSKFSMAEAESTRSSKSGLGSVTSDGKGMTVTGPGASSSSPSLSQLALVANRGLGLEHKVDESSSASKVAS